MLRLSRVSVLLSALLLLASCASGGADQAESGGNVAVPTEGSPAAQSEAVAVEGGTRVTLGSAEALVWGDGGYGVLLAHGAAFDAASWTDQAVVIAALGATVLAVEDISPDGILDGMAYLMEEAGVDAVALIGGSAGADAILRLLADEPDLPDQLILLSPNSAVEGLGPYPKLFIASEDEGVADASRTMAAEGTGPEDEALIVPGSAHAQNLFDSDQADVVLEAMLARMEEFGTG